mgnify:FL=1
MSWETKPMLLKNGLPIPQYYDPVADEWKPYTDTDLKAVRSELVIVKNELQTIKENQLSGDQKVTLSGAIVEEIISFTNVELMNNWSFGETFGPVASTNMLNTQDYREVAIWIKNTGENEQTLHTLLLYSGAFDISVANNISIPSGATVIITAEDYPILKTPFLGLKGVFWRTGNPQTTAHITVLGAR